MHVLLAYDGSGASHEAFNVVARLVHDIHDKVTIVHIADAGKTYLPHELQPAQIGEALENLCVSRFSKSQYSVKIIQNNGRPAREVILQKIHDLKDVSLLVVGSTGRKGPKADANALGTTADYLVRASTVPVLLVKSHVADDFPGTIVVPVDGSKMSHDALLFILHFARKEDRIHVVHVHDAAAEVSLKPEHKAEAIAAKYAEFVAAHPNVIYQTIPRTQATIGAEILEYVAAQGAKLLVISCDGMTNFVNNRPPSLGSTTTYLVREGRIPTLTYHDRENKVYNTNSVNPTHP